MFIIGFYVDINNIRLQSLYQFYNNNRLQQDLPSIPPFYHTNLIIYTQPLNISSKNFLLHLLKTLFILITIPSRKNQFKKIKNGMDKCLWLSDIPVFELYLRVVHDNSQKILLLLSYFEHDIIIFSDFLLRSAKNKRYCACFVYFIRF